MTVIVVIVALWLVYVTIMGACTPPPDWKSNRKDHEFHGY